MFSKITKTRLSSFLGVHERCPPYQQPEETYPRRHPQGLGGRVPGGDRLWQSTRRFTRSWLPSRFRFPPTLPGHPGRQERRRCGRQEEAAPTTAVPGRRLPGDPERVLPRRSRQHHSPGQYRRQAADENQGVQRHSRRAIWHRGRRGPHHGALQRAGHGHQGCCSVPAEAVRHAAAIAALLSEDWEAG